MSDKAKRDPGRPILSAGTQLNSIYEIDELIAVGGMGEVYRGHAIQTEDPVAIKLIRSDLNEAEAAFALFRKEAAALHNLYHEAIVRYYVFTTDPVLGRPYLAMEFVNGESLSAVLRKRALSCEDVHSLMVRIASGLQAAHEQEIIHRDVSPDNIIIPGGEMKRAKIIDFGIARSNRLDSIGTVIGSGFAGKYNYVSPEQLGLFGGDVSPKSDIYSLGLVLAEALRQRPLDMGGNHVDVIEKRRKVPDLSGIDARLRPLLEHMLNPNPRDRPASMAEVAAWSLAAPPAKTGATAPSSLPQKTGVQKTGVNKSIAPKAGVQRTTTSRSVASHAAAQKVPPQKAATRSVGLYQTNEEADKEPIKINFGLVGAAISFAIVAAFGIYVFSRQPHTPIVIPDDKPKVVTTAADGIKHFVAQYDGGPCFFLRPLRITDTSALLDGYGVARGPFTRLDGAFRDQNGFEAEIGVHEVAPSQCPVLNLLGRLRTAQTAAPRIGLVRTALRAGQNLTGTIEGIDGRQIDLLLVADDGSVRHLTSLPYPPADEKMPFSAKLGPEFANGKLQLLVALASEKPMSLVQKATVANAQDFFPRVFDEANRGGFGLAASLRAFKLDK